MALLPMCFDNKEASLLSTLVLRIDWQSIIYTFITYTIVCFVFDPPFPGELLSFWFYLVWMKTYGKIRVVIKINDIFSVVLVSCWNISAKLSQYLLNLTIVHILQWYARGSSVTVVVKPSLMDVSPSGSSLGRIWILSRKPVAEALPTTLP